jgi:hypothetical protein
MDFELRRRLSNGEFNRSSLIGRSQGRSEAGVDGFALHGEDAEDALVDAVQRFTGNEAFQGFDTEGELTLGEGSLLAQAPLAKPIEVAGHQVLGAVDDAEVFRPPTFDPRLDQSTLTGDDRLDGFDDHALATGIDEMLPPGHRRGLAFGTTGTTGDRKSVV